MASATSKILKNATEFPMYVQCTNCKMQANSRTFPYVTTVNDEEVYKMHFDCMNCGYNNVRYIKVSQYKG